MNLLQSRVKSLRAQGASVGGVPVKDFPEMTVLEDQIGTRLRSRLYEMCKRW